MKMTKTKWALVAVALVIAGAFWINSHNCVEGAWHIFVGWC